MNVGKIYKAMEVWPEAECLAGKLAASFSWLAASLPCFIFFSFPSIFLSEPMLTCCFLSPGPFFLLERPAPGRPSGFLFSRLVCSQVSGRGTQAGEDLPPHEWGGPEWKVGGKRGVRLPPEQGETALAHCSRALGDISEWNTQKSFPLTTYILNIETVLLHWFCF